MFRRTNVIIVLVVFVTAVLVPYNYAAAYVVLGKTLDTHSISYTIDPNIDANLRISGSASLIDQAASKWTASSSFSLRREEPYNPNGNIITTANFRDVAPCPNMPWNRADVPGYTCRSADGMRWRTFFNTAFSWNTDGVMAPPDLFFQGRADFLTIALHELGHWHALDHDCSRNSQAVMCPQDSIAKWNLDEDDKRGATQIYGPRTGWEANQAQGHPNQLAISKDIAGYYNSSSPQPELGPRTAEWGVPVLSGQKYEMMSGYARASYSYAYFNLFTSNSASYTNPYDEPTLRTNLVIRRGMKLVWRQYNMQQSTMSVDFVTTDRTTLRDSGLKDQNGVSVHPNARGAYPWNDRWMYFEVDLSPLAGKVIKNWMIAYDNGNNGRTGKFRAYFDDLELQSQTYRIMAVHSGKALDVSNMSKDNGARIQQWDYVNNPNQKWVIEPMGGDYVRIRSVHSGKCLDVAEASQNNGAIIHQWDCGDAGTNNQLWKRIPAGNGAFVIQAKHSGKALDVAGASQSNGAVVHQWQFSGSGGTNQQWRIEPVQ